MPSPKSSLYTLETKQSTDLTKPVASLGHQVGQRVFWEGPKLFKLCPIVLNYVQHIFQRGDYITMIICFVNYLHSLGLAFLAFFHSARLGSGKTLSELHIRYKLILTRVYEHVGWKEYCKDFTAALNMFDVFSTKCNYGKENTSKDWKCIILIFLTSFNMYFVFGYACFTCICLKTAIWLFWGQGLAVFGEDRLATLTSIVRKGSVLVRVRMETI